MPDELVAACSLTCSWKVCHRPAIGAEGLRSYCIRHRPDRLTQLRSQATKLGRRGDWRDPEMERLGRGNASGSVGNGRFPGETRKQSANPKRKGYR